VGFHRSGRLLTWASRLVIFEPVQFGLFLELLEGFPALENCSERSLGHHELEAPTTGPWAWKHRTSALRGADSHRPRALGLNLELGP
jgi:hypothetical protein